MSGGSYDYAFRRDVEEFVGGRGLADVRELADRLNGLGYAQDAVRETEEFILVARQVATRLEAMRDRLGGIWHAVEWWDSGDSGESALLVALARYRDEPLLRCTRCGCEIVREPSPPPAFRDTGYSHVDTRAAKAAGCELETAIPPDGLATA